jgi:uncharacterized membrane protein YqjE
VAVPLMLIPKLAPVVARHLSAYVDLAAADLQVLVRVLVRRFVAAAIAMSAILISLVLACAWIIAAAWDTSWRSLAIGGLLLLFASIAVVSAGLASRRWGADQHPFARLCEEWQSDQQLITDLSVAKAEPESGQAN